MSDATVMRPWEGPRMWLVAAGAITLTVLVTWLLVGVLHVGRDSAKAGTVYDGVYSDQQFDRTAQIRLPSAPTLTLSWTRPQDRLPKDFAQQQDGPQLPPVDGRWIAVKWDSSGDTDYIGSTDSLPRADRIPALALRTGGRTYPLQAANETEKYCSSQCGFLRDSGWIAVDGDGADTTFSVTFDGVTQTVDARTAEVTPGRAAVLYRTTGLLNRKAECGTPRSDRPQLKIELDDCDYVAAQTPWLPDRGWAADGQVWTYLRVTLAGRIYVTQKGEASAPSAFRAEATGYSVSGARLVSRTGIAPSDLAGGSDDEVETETLVLLGPADSTPRLTVSATYPIEADLDRPLTSSTASVTLIWTVTP